MKRNTTICSDFNERKSFLHLLVVTKFSLLIQRETNGSSVYIIIGQTKVEKGDRNILFFRTSYTKCIEATSELVIHPVRANTRRSRQNDDVSNQLLANSNFFQKSSRNLDKELDLH